MHYQLKRSPFLKELIPRPPLLTGIALLDEIEFAVTLVNVPVFGTISPIVGKLLNTVGIFDGT